MLLSALLSGASTHRVIIVDSESLAEHSFDVQARTVRMAALSASALLVLMAALVVAFTPVRNLIPGYGTEELRDDAFLASVRLVALEDSVNNQLQQLAHLRQILTGRIDSTFTVELPAREPVSQLDSVPEATTEPAPEDPKYDVQPAVLADRIPVLPASAPSLAPRSLLLPAMAPVTGYTTQLFDVRTRHYGIDIATDEGNIVRSIGDGYVVFADWTHAGGHTVIVQHADGYLSVFKHNRRLLKRVAERVQQREGIAISGNTGQHSTGPHLHFELWSSGLAQDPRPYLLGL